MVLGVHLADGIHNHAVLIDDVGGAQRALRDFAVHFLLAPCLVGLQDGEVGVGYEVERKFVLGDEFLVRGGTVAAYP